MQLLLNIHNSDMENCKKNNKTKDDLDTSQRCCLVSSACIKLGQCRTPGITYFFLSLWTYLWLSFNFSVHFLPVGLINKDAFIFFGYTDTHQKHFKFPLWLYNKLSKIHFGTKVRSLTKRHKNTLSHCNADPFIIFTDTLSLVTKVGTYINN